MRIPWGVCAAIKLLMLRAEHDRPDLVFVLVHGQVSPVPVSLGVASVDVADLVKAFDTMRLVLVQGLCLDEQARFPV